jgi:purine-binding chemotaxis protein CheW
VHEVTELAAADIEPTPGLGVRWPPAFIRCIGKHRGGFITVLDLGRVFAAIGATTVAARAAA